MSALLLIVLPLGAFCLGIVLGNREARKQRRGWKYYAPSTNPLRDYK